MRSLPALGVLAVPFVLSTAAPAHAAELDVIAHDLCLDNNKRYTVTGIGFTPNGEVELSGLTIEGPITADAKGAFKASYTTPNESSFTPRRITIGAVDLANPSTTASLVVHVVRFGSNVPVLGRPGEVVTWRFAGFPGKTIYGHFRYRGRTVRNYRFGKAQGPCGTLAVRARRLPAKFRSGEWSLQIDGRPLYSVYTRPALRGSFEVQRRR